jgi:thiol:disulfide interchange protein DsbD
MKKLLMMAVVAAALSAKAQLNPVIWSFTSKSLGNKKFEIHMKATIQNGWHLYSQTQPTDAIASPTAFTISANPLLKLDGKIKEIGKMEKMKDATLGVSANQYSDKVDFVQVIKLNANVKTNFSGNVEYQTCDDKKCLPAKKINFNVAIQ